MKNHFPFALALLIVPLHHAMGETTKPSSNPSSNPPKTTTLSTSEAQKLADNVLRETSVLRGLAIKKRVLCGVQSPAQIGAMLKKSMEKNIASHELLAAQIYFQQLKLAPADFNLPDYYLKMMNEQLAGYYDTRTQKFHTTTRVDRLQLQTIMAHELTHALQDQHFGLAKLEKWPKHDSDARLAMQGLVEGDATLAMTHYTARNPLRSLALLASGMMSYNSSTTFLAAPSVLQEILTFPYTKGMTFASALHGRGGWAQINQAYKNLPASTEQILHPEKYFAGDAPVRVPFRNLTPKLGPGWKLLDHDVNGEFGLRIVLQAHMPISYEAAGAAYGWEGDRYAIYQGPKGARLISQVTLWDDENEAREFYLAYMQHANVRMKKEATTRNSALLWKSGSQFIWLQQRGTKVVILEGIGLNRNPDLLAAAL